MTGSNPQRALGVPHAVAVLFVDLMPDTNAYCDTHSIAPPILVIDTGYIEIQLSIPGDRVTTDDLAVIDSVMEATAALKVALVTRLD